MLGMGEDGGTVVAEEPLAFDVESKRDFADHSSEGLASGWNADGQTDGAFSRTRQHVDCFNCGVLAGRLLAAACDDSYQSHTELFIPYHPHPGAWLTTIPSFWYEGDQTLRSKHVP